MRVKLLDPRAKAPTCEHPGYDLGYDLYALEDVKLYKNVATKVQTGIVIDFDYGLTGGIIKDRSSVAAKGVTVSAGVIDNGYRGEIIVLMTYCASHYSPYLYQITEGDKIAQLVPVRCFTSDSIEVVDDLGESTRGDRGFGSSGR
jgi:dUTP pyrophosphatase